jgi:uncharacterized protein (TIGR00725 family)
VEELHASELALAEVSVEQLVAFEERSLAPATRPLVDDLPPKPSVTHGADRIERMFDQQARSPAAATFASVPVQVAVIGGATPTGHEEAIAEEVGRRLAEGGAVVVCGGLGGVMAAACKGARSAGGLTVGILPGTAATDANPWVDVRLPTGLGEGRNLLVARGADAVVAIGGEYGTLSEIAFALRAGKPVIGLETWTLTRPNGDRDEGVVIVDGASDAAAVALALAVGGQPEK